MNKMHMRNLAATTLLAGTTVPAVAQSSVTLYGIIDNGIAYVNDEAPAIGKPGHSVVKAVSQALSGNRWGLRGSEALGGGLSAVFTLESGFSAQTGAAGQGGRLFGRQAFVGIDDKQAGTLLLGRQYDSTFDFLGPFAAWTQFATDYGAHVGDNDNLFQTFRQNNSVKYRSPEFAGISGQAMYAFSNAPGDFSNNRAYNFGLRYAHGPLTIAATYLHLNSPSAGQTGGTNAGGAVGGEFGSGAGSLFYGSFVTRQTVTGAGGRYVWGPASFNVIYTGTHLDYADGTHLHLDNYEANTTYQFTPSLMAGAAYIYTDGRGDGGASTAKFATGNRPKWHQVDLGVDYYLSKRTDIYTSAIYQKAAGDAIVAALNVEGGVSGVGRNSVLMIVSGIRHRF